MIFPEYGQDSVLRAGFRHLCKYKSLPNKDRKDLFDMNHFENTLTYSPYMTSSLTGSILRVLFGMSIEIPKHVSFIVGGVLLFVLMGNPGSYNRLDRVLNACSAM